MYFQTSKNNYIHVNCLINDVRLNLNWVTFDNFDDVKVILMTSINWNNVVFYYVNVLKFDVNIIVIAVYALVLYWRERNINNDVYVLK